MYIEFDRAKVRQITQIKKIIVPNIHTHNIVTTILSISHHSYIKLYERKEMNGIRNSTVAYHKIGNDMSIRVHHISTYLWSYFI